MPEPAKLQKALLVQLKSGNPDDATKLEVQFNPDSLRVSYGNQVVQPSSSGNVTEGATQWVGTGTTRLSLALVFDVTAPPLDKDPAADVRKATAKVIALVTPGAPEQRAGEGEGAKPITVHPAPKVRFDWGSFRFDGYVDSIEESLEHFSADGRPLRSSLQLALSTQEIQHAFDPGFKARPSGAPSPGAAGIGSGFTASAGIGIGGTVQGLADAAGLGGSWQQIAAANGIENPRGLAPGVSIDLGIGVR
jgi:contractile injection system tube protein